MGDGVSFWCLKGQGSNLISTGPPVIDFVCHSSLVWSFLILPWLSALIFRDLLWEGQRLRHGQCELMADWVLMGVHSLEKAEEGSQENRSSEEVD